MKRIIRPGPAAARHFRTWKWAGANRRTLVAAMENTKKDFVEHVLDLLREFGPVTAKPMFGGWGLYHEGLFFALIAEDMLYLKVDEANRAEFDDAHLEPF